MPHMNDTTEKRIARSLERGFDETERRAALEAEQEKIDASRIWYQRGKDVRRADVAAGDLATDVRIIGTRVRARFTAELEIDPNDRWDALETMILAYMEEDPAAPVSAS